jgi:hypothetical protein
MFLPVALSLPGGDTAAQEDLSFESNIGLDQKDALQICCTCNQSVFLASAPLARSCQIMFVLAVGQRSSRR